jgi:Ser/Thr protein kinase RdoA (MazF antagonist)
MSFFAQDRDGQIARLNQLAVDALDYYDLSHAEFHLHSYTNNAIYRVINGQACYALRIHRPGHKRLAWIRSELTWLDAIRCETDLCVPEPFGSVYAGQLDGVAQPVICDLFGWIDGKSLQPDAISLEHVSAIGSFAAHLHNLSAKFHPPRGFERPRLDWDGLFGSESPYRSAGETQFFSQEQRKVLDDVAQRVKAVMAALDSNTAGFGLIHADLLPKNVIQRNCGETNICLTDFDDCAFGYFLYELAPLLWVYREDRRYDDVRAALVSGYIAVRALPESHQDYLETFVAARHVASCRWVAGNAQHPDYRDRAPQIIAGRIDELRRFLSSGKL